MSAITNGASLEDCLTNIFSLIDLNGLRWKRFKLKENNNHLYTPIDTHPILITYAKCIEENHIAVWRNEPQRRHTAQGSSQGGGSSAGSHHQNSASHSNYPTPTRTSNNNTPTGCGPSNLTNSGNQAGGGTNSNAGAGGAVSNSYELWIFGYGHQLKVDDVISEDLCELEDETWDSKGLSYECRTLLFKALHNLIERCYIQRGFTKLGRWFVQPQQEVLNNHIDTRTINLPNGSSNPTLVFNNASNVTSSTSKSSSTSTSAASVNSSKTTNKQQAAKAPEHNSINNASKSVNLSSTISLTIHKFIDSRRETFERRRHLTELDGLRHTTNRSTNSYFTTALDGSKVSLSFAFSFFVHGDSTICATVDVRQHPLIHPLSRSDLSTYQVGGVVRVALAPYGLNGILNGVSYKDSDNGAATASFVQKWSRFYPLPKTMARMVSTTNNIKASPTSAMSNFGQRQDNLINYNHQGDVARSYLSNLTNMLPPSTHKPILYFEHGLNEVPPVVEVIVAGYRMRYPSECVFTVSKVVDICKPPSLLASKASSASQTKRPSKASPTKPNKLSLLSEKLTEDKLDSQTQQEHTRNPTDDSLKSNDASVRLNFDGVHNSGNQTKEETNDRKIVADSCNDADSTNSQANPNNSLSSQTTISRYSSTKSNFTVANPPLGPADLVKLFPTPPSLEQIAPSPSTLADESAAKDSNAIACNQNIDLSKDKDCGIDVYKPVEYALMPPPPKWAALTNIIISNSKSLPPECIYKGSPQSITKNSVTKLGESAKPSLLRNSNASSKQNSFFIKSIDSPCIPSPLADQVNESVEFGSAPKSVSTSLLSNSMQLNLNQKSSTSSSTSNTPAAVSSFTLPHQRLFNSLHELDSIQMNLSLSDSVLGMFRDHNFESCTMCVCNMSIKGSNYDSLPQRTETGYNQWKLSLGSESSPFNNQSQSNEFLNECTCGFSAMNNRAHGHLSGLFFEDELDLTNILYDPTEMIDQNKLFRKIRLSNYSEASYNEENKLLNKLLDTGNKPGSNSCKSASDDILKLGMRTRDEKSSQASQATFEETSIFAIEQLKQHCSTIIHSNSSLSRVLLIESFRNNRHLTSSTNYYAQATASKASISGPLQRFMDDPNNKFTTVRTINKNPNSLRFSDLCEITKTILTKIANQSQKLRVTNSLVKPLGSSSTSQLGLSSIFSRMFSPTRQFVGKSSDSINARNNIFAQGLQALVTPMLSTDPKGALQMLEYLIKDESKEALVTLNKAILVLSSSMHDWQFLGVPVPENNFDVANLLKVLQPSLDESVGRHNKLWKDFVHRQQQHSFSARDSPSAAPVRPTPPCQGPLTWRQFHQAAGRGTEDQCEPQPIPSLLVGHHVEKNHLALSPFALKFWDKLLLEPYAPGHNLFYLVITPDNPSILSHTHSFFKELSNTYELMKLGRHIPIGSGIVAASSDGSSNPDVDSWFSKLNLKGIDPAEEITTKLKSYASKLNSALAKAIVDYLEERQPPYDPHADRFDPSPNPNAPPAPINPIIARPNPSQSSRPPSSLLGSCHPKPGLPSLTTQPQPMLPHPQVHQQHQHHLQPQSLLHQTIPVPHDPIGHENQAPVEQTNLTKSLVGSSSHGNSEDPVLMEDEANKQAGIVIYLIDPFSSPNLHQNIRTLATIGLFRCYSLLLEHLPENIKRITQLQLLSLDTIISHSKPVGSTSKADQLKALSMNIYSHCRSILANHTTAKSLTGFGPASVLEAALKTKSPDLYISKVFTPPFILAPMKDKQTELGEMFGDRREKSSVIFCSYCITEDQRWLLASVTNDKGEMSETTVININVLDRMKRPKTSVRRVALRKLMDFIISVMSDWTNPWRLIIGKLGRVGHGELKEWAALMSKRSLLSYSRKLTERCRQCSILPPTETVTILSACLVSLEPDTQLRIMPDQFTSDDRQASFNKCPLSTPEDASATHILVFPTSASMQSAHGIIEDPLGGSGLEDDLLSQFPLDQGMDDLDQDNMDDLFTGWDDGGGNVGDQISGVHHDSMMSSSNLQMASGSVGDAGANQDETLQLLQQPLALGYYMSTAKIGHMPNWFWSTCPHLRNVCPVFLKSALHIHMPSVQLSDDLLHSGQIRKSHQLDSILTTDVLRYVLEGYNSLSWLALNPKTYDRLSCLPIHMQNLVQLYHLMESFS